MQADRRPVVTDGERAGHARRVPAAHGLWSKANFDTLRAKEAHRLAPERAEARAKFIAEQAERIAKRTGCSLDAARRSVEQQCDGVLLSDVVLQFDDTGAGRGRRSATCWPTRRSSSAKRSPTRWRASPTASNKAKVLQRADGTPWIYSFAHGRTDYELRHSAGAIEAILDATEVKDLVTTYARLAGDLDADDRLAPARQRGQAHGHRRENDRPVRQEERADGGRSRRDRLTPSAAPLNASTHAR